MDFEEIILFQELGNQQIAITVLGPKILQPPSLLRNSPLPFNLPFLKIFLAPSFWPSAKISKSPILIVIIAFWTPGVPFSKNAVQIPLTSSYIPWVA